MYKEQDNFISFKKCFKDLRLSFYGRSILIFHDILTLKLFILWGFYQCNKD